MFELYLGDVHYPEGNVWDKAYKPMEQRGQREGYTA